MTCQFLSPDLHRAIVTRGLFAKRWAYVHRDELGHWFYTSTLRRCSWLLEMQLESLREHAIRSEPWRPVEEMPAVAQVVER